MKGKDVVAASTCIIALAMFLACIFGANQTGFRDGARKMQQEAIERGYAEYDAKTGEWKWKGEVSK